MQNNLEVATFAGGCFWCTEAIFKRINGVSKVSSGYSGGDIENPTYEQVCRKDTGHAEAVQLEFDPKVIAYKDLVEIFFNTHDPTTLNRQGNDVGPQYRSVIFYHNEQQQREANDVKNALEISNKSAKPIVTKVEKFKNFYIAEKYHQNFFAENQTYPYCQLIIEPKVKKFLNDYKDVTS